MNLKDEFKEVYNNRPAKGESIRYKADAAKRGKHGAAERRRAFPRKKPYIAAIFVMAIAAIAMLIMIILIDVLPPDLAIIASVLIIALLMFTCFMFSSRYRWKRIIGIVIAALFIVLTVGMASFMTNTFTMFNQISSAAVSATGPQAKSVNVTEEPFNIYITGIDQWEEEEGLDLERSDVNMIVTVNPVTKKVLMTSIPRDSYVKLHTAQQMDKLTHTGIYGVDETLNTVEDWLGIDINYYVKMNFSAVRDIINAMGGVKVYSPVAFDSSLRPYHYYKGWNRLSGSKALFFARERHAFEGQDSIRVENQQRLMKAIIKKMTSSTTMLTSYGDIMAAAGKNMSTNMSADDMTALVKMQIADLAEWDIESQKMKGDYGMGYVASLSSAHQYSIYNVSTESLQDCVSGITEVSNPSAEELKAATENSSKAFIINMINRVKEQIEETAGKKDEEK